MKDSQGALQFFLKQRGLSLDPIAMKVLRDDYVVRVWSSNGDLIHYNELMKSMTSYTPLDLCYYNLKTLWKFEDDGFDIFKTLMAQALVGKELGGQKAYSVRETQGQQWGALHRVELAVPLFQDEKIQGILVAGHSELFKKPA